MKSQPARNTGQPTSPVDVVYVDRGKYCQLALSTRKLVRSDKRHLGLRGLLDPAIGKCYVIAENDLFGSFSSRVAIT